MKTFVELLKAILLALMPISEIRGSIPLAVYYHLQEYMVLLILSNMLVVPISYLFLDKVHKRLLKYKAYRRWFNKKVAHTRKKFGPMLEKYGYWALMFFVGIPLPFTGAYTGTLAAWIFGLDRRKASFYIYLGVVLASAITYLAVVSGIGAFSFFTKRFY